MMAMGGGVRGGIFGTAPSLDPNPANPTLENNGGDVGSRPTSDRCTPRCSTAGWAPTRWRFLAAISVRAHPRSSSEDQDA